MTENHVFLNPYQKELLKRAQGLPIGDLPAPWIRGTVFAGAGIMAGGWLTETSVIMMSVGRLTVYDIATGYRTHDIDDENYIASFLRSLLITFEKRQVILFGVNGGDGLHITEDGWELSVIYPYWPNSLLCLHTPFIAGVESNGVLDRAYVVKTRRLDDWIKCGFSESGRAFIVIGSGGIELFYR